MHGAYRKISVKTRLTYTQKKSLVSIYVLSLNQQYCIYHCQFFYMSCIIVALHVPVYCVTNNASIRLINQFLKCTMCTCCGKPAGSFAHKLLGIERELFVLQ